jgi:hypothetical protein
MAALPAPKLRHVYRLDADLAAPIDLGDTPQGHRRIVALTGGRAEGPDFNAELLATGGADWQLVRASGSSVADIRYTLKPTAGRCSTSSPTAYATASQRCSPGWPPARTSTLPSTRSAPR